MNFITNLLKSKDLVSCHIMSSISKDLMSCHISSFGFGAETSITLGQK